MAMERSAAGNRRRAPEIAAGEAAAEGRERGGGVQSIERAFAILEEIARHRDGISLAELSKRVGLHNSTTFHLARTMLTLGYIHQVKETKRYRMGRRLFTLAAGAVDEIELASMAVPVLEALSHATGESGHFAVRSNDEIVVIAKTTGTGMFQANDRVGMVRPAHSTALGKVLLASLTPDQLERQLSTRALERYTARTIVDRAELAGEIERVRARGIAFDDGEYDAETRCVAVPVRDFTGRVAGAIGISGPIWRLSIQALQDKAERVREAAEALSRELGFGSTLARSAAKAG